MIMRLRQIASGKLQATDYDLKFYTHELREFVRYRKAGQPFTTNLDLYNTEHATTLYEYGLYKDLYWNFLYHPDAQILDPEW